MTVTAFVGLGSNQGDPLHHVLTAIDEMQVLSSTALHTSPLYGSKAVGPGEQPDYINAVTQMSVELPPDDLLVALHDIERAHQRERKQRWAARTLDLDLLLYGDVVVDQPGLRVPHPRIAERPFVIYPLLDLAPTLDIPGKGPLQHLQTACPAVGIWRLHDG